MSCSCAKTHTRQNGRSESPPLPPDSAPLCSQDKELIIGHDLALHCIFSREGGLYVLLMYIIKLSTVSGVGWHDNAAMLPLRKTNNCKWNHVKTFRSHYVPKRLLWNNFEATVRSKWLLWATSERLQVRIGNVVSTKPLLKLVCACSGCFKATSHFEAAVHPKWAWYNCFKHCEAAMHWLRVHAPVKYKWVSVRFLFVEHREYQQAWH